MSFRFPIETFFESSGNASAAFGELLRDEVATFACELWSNYPDWMTKGLNPANAFARGFMNRMCLPIQAPVPAPPTTFSGGQCPGIQYRLQYYAIKSVTNNNNEPLFVDYSQLFTDTFDYTGAITKVELLTDTGVPISFADYLANGKNFVAPYNLAISDSLFDPHNFFSFANSWGIFPVRFVRTDGMEDTCGNLPDPYGSPEPTSDDLIKEVPIPNPDGIDNLFIIQYNKQTTNYNFPIGFKVNGINVVIDFGGINIYAPDSWGTPSGGNDLPPPGSDGGDDGEGGGNTTIFRDVDYPIAPVSPVPRLVEQLFTSLVCTDGVIETIEPTLQLAVGFQPILSLIIEILGQILTDLCETPEASLGLPEYYGLNPGADRPAIVYLWKIYADEKWSASTYSSTVHYPTSSAIADIPNLGSIEKTIGTFKTFIRLVDGSVIQATGGNELQSQANFDFLLSQVTSAFVPIDVMGSTIKQTDDRLQVKTLRLRQVEYYPTGKANNANPSIKRIIPPPP